MEGYAQLNYDIQNIEVNYLGERNFQNEELIENMLIFRKRNSRQIACSLLVPMITDTDIYKIYQIKKNQDIDIESFRNSQIEVIINNIIFIYNKINMISYLSKYQNNSLGISNDISKKNIYKVNFKIEEQIEYIYFDLQESQLFL